MDKCEICGGDDAYLVCARCGRNVCSGCYGQESRLCVSCSDIEKTSGSSELPQEGPMRTFGRLFPLAIAFIFIGMLLMMLASILSFSGGEGGGGIVVFPFFFVSLSGTLAFVVIVAFLVLSLTFVFLPWILGPKRILRVAERITGLKSGDLELRKGKKIHTDGVEDYLITLKMPGFKEENIEVRVFHNELTVQASKNGEVFRKTYELPRGFEPKGVKYNLEADFLVIRVSLKPKEGA